MSTKAKLLIVPWIVVGIGLLVAVLALDFRFPEPARFVTCLVLALLGSTFKIKLPGMQGTFSISFVLARIAIAQMTLTESLVVGVLATLVQCFWRTRKSPTPVQVLFNISTLVVSVVLAFGVLTSLRNAGAFIPGLVVAALLFFIVNSGLVSLVLALPNSQSAVSISEVIGRRCQPRHEVAEMCLVNYSVDPFVWIPEPQIPDPSRPCPRTTGTKTDVGGI